mmetsp:Transcript_1676/g.1608  ORF Transcript_1676/g.1608 Transcript_1676/m.1608 type:complete len:151 (-) Transcript_1676:1142-1594(-)|eukprot:CAMPEP_0170542470 /NCGR_PEP_ID=MMETSP0211-20121228/1879_1 /TAXON_ID=311385 /ORGANISM="Pseudokeronopsis sp., Strain OXSARD2" /LENGTH=150 /DNA_ID=CAMNT_0010845533 /DNA_START=418 /DNA_END=870 /DNA_ORIENTATION=-
MSRSRQEDKWRSSVFDVPDGNENQVKRKKLGGEGAGTDKLFGSEKVDFDNKSSGSVLFSSKKDVKKWKPVRQEKTADQRKNEELYGISAKKWGVGPKKDGTLTCKGSDWRATNQTHSNSPVKQQRNDLNDNCKDKKYQNLQSNIFGADEY